MNTRMSADGPIWESYADAELGSECPNCGAGPNVWCSSPDGRIRRVPCIGRILKAEAAVNPIVDHGGTDSTGACADCGRIPARCDTGLCDFCTNYARQQVVTERMREIGRRHREEHR
jgi:hypothetical protein